MQRPVIAWTCAVFVAMLVVPGAALAKGGNGLHSLPGAPGQVKKADGSPSGNAAAANPGKAIGRTSASSASSSAGKALGKTSARGGAPAPSAANGPATVPSEASPAALAQSTGLAAHVPAAAAIPGAGGVFMQSALLPSSGLAQENTLTSPATEGNGAETRGVLDTIRFEVGSMLEGVRATAVRLWSTVFGWFGS